jgi:hypothetical protein
MLPGRALGSHLTIRSSGPAPISTKSNPLFANAGPAWGRTRRLEARYHCGGMATKSSDLERLHVRLAWLALTANLAGLGVQLLLPAAGCAPILDLAAAAPSNRDSSGLIALLGLPFAALGVLITSRRPENRIGRLCTAAAGLFGLLLAMLDYVACGLPRVEAGGQWPGLVVAARWAEMAAWLLVYAALVLLPLWFPTGQDLSPRWRRATWLATAVFAATWLVVGFWPVPLSLLAGTGLDGIVNPLALPLALTPAGQAAANEALPLLLGALALFGGAALIVRWRRASGDLRQQLKWFAYGVAVLGSFGVGVELYGYLVNPAIFNSWFYLAELAAWWLGYPLAVGLAVFKYRLYDIDLIIRRTLAYSVLTVLLALVYWLGVAGLQAAFRALTGSDSSLAIIGTTLLIAALFQPLRNRVQGVIDRRFYRRHYDAGQVVARFGARVRDEAYADLDRLTGDLLGLVEETLEPESVGLVLVEGGKRGA